MFFRCNTLTISYFGLYYSIWGCSIIAVLLQVTSVGASVMMSVLLLGWVKHGRIGRLSCWEVYVCFKSCYFTVACLRFILNVYCLLSFNDLITITKINFCCVTKEALQAVEMYISCLK